MLIENTEEVNKIERNREMRNLILRCFFRFFNLTDVQIGVFFAMTHKKGKHEIYSAFNSAILFQHRQELASRAQHTDE